MILEKLALRRGSGARRHAVIRWRCCDDEGQADEFSPLAIRSLARMPKVAALINPPT